MADKNKKIIERENNKIAKKSKTSFLYSTFFMDKEKSNALKAVYSFCRKSDDIVDNDEVPKADKQKNLDNWRLKFTGALAGKTEDDFLLYLMNVIKKYKISSDYFMFLLDGMQMDLTGSGFRTFEDLYNYCYCVASTVGLISIEIIGYKSSTTKDYAVNLGIALQLTNILRDIRQDAADGRIYLPAEDLIKYGYSEKEILNNVYNENFIELMRFEAERAKEYYNNAEINLNKADYKSLFPARIIEATYLKILKSIEKHKYDVYHNKIKVSKIKKLLIPFYLLMK